MSRTFTVTAQRTRTGWWVLEADEVGAVSQVRRLDQAAEDIREAVAYLAGLPEDQVVIDVVPTLPAAYREHATAAEQATAEATEARSRAAVESRAAARALRDEGLTLRDVGRVMGVSHQRAQQLVEDAEETSVVLDTPNDVVPFERSTPASAS